jgi:hypothetical protein
VWILIAGMPKIFQINKGGSACHQYKASNYEGDQDADN